ncbi:VOC family protein [Sphingorhabdus sp. EL138]|uniref:VOC family protein n=1 Tax=Sphingorhabdus sp. EL138 TaxID=2073156 RepID=UPI00349E7EB3
MTVPDLGAAKPFYETVFGWEIDEHGLVTNTSSGLSLSEGTAMDARTAYFSVADLDECLSSVVSSGGEILEQHSPQSGKLAICRDNQGTIIAIRNPAQGFE